MSVISNVLGSYRQTFTTGLVTGVAAGTASAGHIAAFRYATAGKYARIKSLEVEFLCTTAFTASQELGFDAIIARSYSAAHTGGTAATIASNDGKRFTSYATATLTAQIASTGALTAGTQTLDSNAVCGSSVWLSSSGAGGQLGPRFYDFTADEPVGILLSGAGEGIIIRNSIAMGAGGVGRWRFTLEWDQVIVTAAV